MRINKRDALFVNREIVRLQLLPDYAKVKKIAVVGGFWGYPVPVKTVIGDMNLSAFGASWSKSNSIKEITGIDFLPLNELDKKKIEEYCAKYPKRDKIDYVAIIDDIGLIWIN